MTTTRKSNYRVFHCLCLVTAVLSVTAAAGLPQDPQASLAFAKSPNTNLHIALQPRADHHRIHFLIHARGLRMTRCVAKLVCDENVAENFESPMSVDAVHFTPDKDDQTFSIYLRTPKVSTKSLTYVLVVKPAPPWDRTVVTEGIIAYKWTINRDADGTAEIVLPERGRVTEIMYPVHRAVPQDVEVDGQIVTKWRVVAEVKTIQLAVPEEFTFAVNESDQGIQDVVRPLN